MITLFFIWAKLSYEIEIKNNVYVQALRNEHVKAPKGIHKSLSYKVIKSRNL